MSNQTLILNFSLACCRWVYSLLVEADQLFVTNQKQGLYASAQILRETALLLKAVKDMLYLGYLFYVTF